MTVHRTIAIRRATADDAETLARLIDIAGEGIPNWLWSARTGPGQFPLDVGAERARRETGGFSYRNARLAVRHGEVAGMVLAYPIEAPAEADRAAVPNLPEPIRPMVELEHASAGTYYINALAVFPGRRGRGLGTALLGAAEDLARTAGHERMSIQVFEQNEGAVRLYRRHGFGEADARPVLSHPCQPYYDGRILLLTKPL